MKRTENRKIGIFFMLLSSLLYGSYGVWARLLGPVFPTFFQSWTRAFLILLILFVILRVKKIPLKIYRKDWKLFGLLGACTSLTLAPVYYAFNHMDISLVTLIFYSSIVIANYVFSFIMFKEKITYVKKFALVQSLIGIVLLYSFVISTNFTALAFIAATVNGIATALEFLFSKKLTETYDAIFIMFVAYVFIFLSNLIISLILKEPMPFTAPAKYWGYQTGFLLAALGAYYFGIRGYEYLTATMAGLISVSEAVFGLLLGLIFFGDKFDSFRIAGAFVILTAMLLPKLGEMDINKALEESRADR